LVIEYWNLFVIWKLRFGALKLVACILEFRKFVYWLLEFEICLLFVSGDLGFGQLLLVFCHFQ
jgi:hypothetical protein